MIPAELYTTPPLELPLAFDAVSVGAGALSGAMHATRKQFDVLGTIAIALATGLGGGIIRDLLLEQGTPVFLVNAQFLPAALAGSILGMLFARWASRWSLALVAVDVATLGVWVILAAQKSILAGLPVIGVVFVGTVAAVGGGLLRDLLCGDTPAAFRPGQWSAIAAFFAAVTFVTFNQIPTPFWLDVVATLAVAGGLRWAAIRFDLRTAPVVAPRIAR